MQVLGRLQSSTGAAAIRARDLSRTHRESLLANGFLQEVIKGWYIPSQPDERKGESTAWYALALFRCLSGEAFREGLVPLAGAPADLAGYRTGQVYIRRSMHVPLNRDAVRDAMPAFFDLLRGETDPAVRAVLGHFVFVYIHPYMDGNGRMGRFLMNLMLASGGYPWTVIPVGIHKTYMDALENSSVGEDIVPFTAFLAGLVERVLAGEPLPEVPNA